MVLNVDVINFGWGQEPQASWRHNCASIGEAMSLFNEAAHGASYDRLHLKVEGALVAVAYRHGDDVQIVMI